MGLLFLANNVCFLTAYERTTVSNAVLTHYTAPVFVAVLAPLALRERVLPVTPLSLLLASVGMVLLLPGVHWSWEDRHLQGLVLGTASGLAYGILIVVARALALRVAALPLLFVQNAVVAVVLLPGLALLGLPRQPAVLGALFVLGIVHATGAALLYLAGLRRVRAQTAAILGYLEPLLAVALAALVLGERLAPGAAVGGGLILASGALVVWAEGRAPKGVDAPAAGR
jgi:drug/metabolite transporter (DMT)-like permease